MGDRVVVAMSGGVDSSTCAALLVEQGLEVIGISMQLWDYSAGGNSNNGKQGDKFDSCCSPDDLADARRVAEILDIPYYVINFEKEFRQNVVSYFVDDYLRGRTPNPCVMCNQYLKFDALLDMAEQLEAAAVATGHYANVVRCQGKGRFTVRRARDRSKDQSYFLFSLTQAQLQRIRFPLGSVRKEEVRNLARLRGLPVADKGDSQEICFIPDHDYGGFLKGQIHAPVQPGAVVNAVGEVLGTHRGLPFYTQGQRKGLGLTAPSPFYVIDKDPLTNRLVVGGEGELLKREFLVERVNWCLLPSLEGELSCTVQIRHRHGGATATIAPEGPPELGRVRVRFHQEQRAITPGQAAVFYDGELLLGGGWISQILN